MEFLFVSNYGFWKTHYTFIIKSDLKKTLSTVRCQALKSWLWVSTYVHKYAFKAGGESDLIHKLLFFKFNLFIQNWQSSINNLPIQTISNWGPIFVQRWMLWYIVGIFLQNDNDCTEFYSNLFSPDT